MFCLIEIDFCSVLVDLGAHNLPKARVLIFTVVPFGSVVASRGQDNPETPLRALQESSKSLPIASQSFQEPSQRALGADVW